jgi:hypothetical protein
MNEYKIKYHDGDIGCTAILIGLLSPIVIGGPIVILIMHIIEIVSIVIIVIIILLFPVCIVLITLCIFKKQLKCIKFRMNDEFLDINDGEKKIYYNKIYNINLRDNEYISHYGGGYNRNFNLDIYYNETDKFALFIYTIDKNNYDLFSKFLQEINKKHENSK